LSDSYITPDALKASLSLSGESYADADILLAISAASDQINQQCNRRTFSLDSSATERLYWGDGSFVFIDDAVDVTLVEIGPGDGTFPYSLSVGTDYDLEPLNASADGEPYTKIRIRRHGNAYGHHCHRQVRVTGTFGWPAVPDLVLSATSLLAGRFVRRIREAPFGVIQVGLESQPARIAVTDPDICSMLTPLTKFLVR
jgi:hypothetical protein